MNVESPTPPSDLRGRDFAFLWALGTLVHLAHGTRLTTLSGIAEASIAAAVLAWPRSRRAFGALAALQLACVVDDFPYVANHTVLIAFVDIVILASIARGLPRPDRPDAVASLLSGTRALLVLTYAWAAVHKLNEGFIDPTTSCAVDQATRLAGLFRIEGIGDIGARLAIHGTLAIELTLPVLLCWRRTRRWGVVLGLAFHFLLGINGFQDFSAIALALLVGFLDREQANRARESIHRVVLGRSSAWQPGTALRIACAVALVSSLRLVAEPKGLAFFVWCTYACATLLVAVALARSSMTPNGTYKRLAPRLGSVSAMLCVLFCCNAATPYLGLKTDVSIAMFSNLRTEGAYWNHLVIPSDVRIFDLQDEPIMIVGTTSPHFAGFIEDPQWLVEEDLREMVQFVASGQDAPIWLEIEQAGRIRVVPDARVDPVLGQPVGPVAAKLTRFRKIPAAVNVCTH